MRLSGFTNIAKLYVMRLHRPTLVFCAQAFMAEQREDVTPEECKERYDEYKADYMQRLTLSFMDVHRQEVRPF